MAPGTTRCVFEAVDAVLHPLEAPGSEVQTRIAFHSDVRCSTLTQRPCARHRTQLADPLSRIWHATPKGRGAEEREESVMSGILHDLRELQVALELEQAGQLVDQQQELKALQSYVETAVFPMLDGYFQTHYNPGRVPGGADIAVCEDIFDALDRIMNAVEGVRAAAVMGLLEVIATKCPSRVASTLPIIFVLLCLCGQGPDKACWVYRPSAYKCCVTPTQVWLSCWPVGDATSGSDMARAATAGGFGKAFGVDAQAVHKELMVTGSATLPVHTSVVQHPVLTTWSMVLPATKLWCYISDGVSESVICTGANPVALVDPATLLGPDLSLCWCTRAKTDGGVRGLAELLSQLGEVPLYREQARLDDRDESSKYRKVNPSYPALFRRIALWVQVRLPPTLCPQTSHPLSSASEFSRVWSQRRMRRTARRYSTLVTRRCVGSRRRVRARRTTGRSPRCSRGSRRSQRVPRTFKTRATPGTRRIGARERG